MLERLKTKFFSDKSRSNFIKDSAMAMSLKLLGIASSYIFILLITKNFGAEGWGKYSLTMSFIIFWMLLGKIGFDLALLKYTSSNEAKNDRHLTKQIYVKGISFCLGLCIFLTLILMIFSKDIAVLLFQKEYMSDFIFYSSFLIICQIGYIIHSEGLRGLKKYNAYQFIQFIGAQLFGSILLFLYPYFTEKNDLLPLKILVISSFIVFLISTYLWLKEILFIKSKNLFSFPLKQIIRVSFPMFISNAMFVTLNWIDTLLLGIYQVDEAEIGVYNISLKVAAIINLPLLAVSGIVASSISEQHTLGNTQQLQKIIKDSSLLIFSATLAIYIAFLIYPTFFLGFFGQNFTKGTEVLLIVSSGFLVSSFSGCTDIILQMTNNEKLFQNIIIGATLLNVLLNLILIPYWGIKGSAIASMCSICFWNILSVYYIKKRLGVNSLII